MEERNKVIAGGMAYECDLIATNEGTVFPQRPALPESTLTDISFDNTI